MGLRVRLSLPQRCCGVRLLKGPVDRQGQELLSPSVLHALSEGLSDFCPYQHIPSILNDLGDKLSHSSDLLQSVSNPTRPARSAAS